MTQPPPRERPGGPSRNKSYHIKKEVGDVIEISDSSDYDDYEDAHGSRQVPSQPPPPPRPQNRQLGFFDVRNQMIGLDEGDNLNPQYLHPLLQPAAAAAAMPRINMNQRPPVKNEEPEIDWARWMDGENDEQVNRILWEDYTNQAESNRSSNLSSGLHQLIQQPNQPRPIMETEVECINAVMAVFPEICRDHVVGLYETSSQSSDQLISHILDKVDTGSPYPTAKDAQRKLKRKREFSEEEEAIQKYEVANRNNELTSFLQQSLIRSILSFEFLQTPMTFIDSTLQKSGHRLFPAHRALEEAHRTFDTANPKYNKIKNPRRMPTLYREAEIEEAIQKNETSWKTEIFKELQVARRFRNSTESRRRAQREAELAEEENERVSQAEGTMSECGCCFGDYPLNRMVHCNNEEVLHWFCRGCARQTAENEIGNSKYELNCMSTDGCEAGFSLEQRNQFLDEPTIIALERNEAEAVLRMAGIENLASCPFCPYAAEYPPAEVNREFRCEAPDCEKVSCRLCKLESHIPKSCEENARENGLSARRQIEEAMSAAMIRKCNKCGTPFVKEEGCNKMTCTRNGCLNVQCYVCSKSCGYDHFNDRARGGQEGNCPLFESVEDRHNSEVKRAEREALDKVRAEHPEYSEEDLKVKMSESVVKDDEMRRDPLLRHRMVPHYLPRDQALLLGIHAEHRLDVLRINRIQNELENLRNPRDLELQLPAADYPAPPGGPPIIFPPVAAGADIPMVPLAANEQSQEEEAKVKEQNKLEAVAEAKARTEAEDDIVHEVDELALNPARYFQRMQFLFLGRPNVASGRQGSQAADNRTAESEECQGQDEELGDSESDGKSPSRSHIPSTSLPPNSKSNMYEEIRLRRLMRLDDERREREQIKVHRRLREVRICQELARENQEGENQEGGDEEGGNEAGRIEEGGNEEGGNDEGGNEEGGNDEDPDEESDMQRLRARRYGGLVGAGGGFRRLAEFRGPGGFRRLAEFRRLGEDRGSGDDRGPGGFRRLGEDRGSGDDRGPDGFRRLAELRRLAEFRQFFEDMIGRRAQFPKHNLEPAGVPWNPNLFVTLNRNTELDGRIRSSLEMQGPARDTESQEEIRERMVMQQRLRRNTELQERIREILEMQARMRRVDQERQELREGQERLDKMEGLQRLKRRLGAFSSVFPHLVFNKEGGGVRGVEGGAYVGQVQAGALQHVSIPEREAQRQAQQEFEERRLADRLQFQREICQGIHQQQRELELEVEEVLERKAQREEQREEQRRAQWEVQEEVQERMQQRVHQEMQQEMQQEVHQEMPQGIQEEVQHEVHQEIQQELQEEVQQEIPQETQEELHQEIQQEVSPTVHKPPKKDINAGKRSRQTLSKGSRNIHRQLSRRLVLREANRDVGRGGLGRVSRVGGGDYVDGVDSEGGGVMMEGVRRSVEGLGRGFNEHGNGNERRRDDDNDDERDDDEKHENMNISTSDRGSDCRRERGE